MPRNGKTPTSFNKRPTMNDVAKRAGVSPVSVSRVMNNHPSVKESTKEKVRKAVEDLGYFPNAAAQEMRTNSSDSIGVIITDISNTANGQILQGAESVINQAGKLMIATHSNFDIEREQMLIEHMQRRRVAGIILQTGHEESENLHRQIKNCTVPIVVLDRDLPFEIDSVICEHYMAARETVRYLIELGHRRIGLIAAETTTRPGHERVRGYCDELEAAGIAIDQSLIRSGSHLTEHGLHETKSMMALSEPPTAIFAGGNHLYIGCLQAVRSLGLKIPEDISVVGADEAEFSALFTPPLTIVNRDMAQLGKKAAELLLSRIENTLSDEPRKLVIPSQVILRSSCASPSQHL